MLEIHINYLYLSQTNAVAKSSFNPWLWKLVYYLIIIKPKNTLFTWNHFFLPVLLKKGKNSIMSKFNRTQAADWLVAWVCCALIGWQRLTWKIAILMLLCVKCVKESKKSFVVVWLTTSSSFVTFHADTHLTDNTKIEKKRKNREKEENVLEHDKNLITNLVDCFG